MNNQNYSPSEDIIGKPVENSLGQEYGKVSDIIALGKQNKAAAIVVAKGGFLGMGADHFVLPWSKVRVNPNTQRVMVEADRKTIEDAPLVDIDKIKGGDAAALSQLYNYYGVEEFWKEPSSEDAPMNQNYESGQDIGERLPDNEGSHQITKHYPGQRNSHIREEADYDKIKGIKQSDKK